MASVILRRVFRKLPLSAFAVASLVLVQPSPEPLPSAEVPLLWKMHSREKKPVGEQRQRDRVQQREMHARRHSARALLMRWRRTWCGAFKADSIEFANFESLGCRVLSEFLNSTRDVVSIDSAGLISGGTACSIAARPGSWLSGTSFIAVAHQARPVASRLVLFVGHGPLFRGRK